MPNGHRYHPPEFFLAEALKKRLIIERGKYARLADRITKAHSRATGVAPEARYYVDRRKLKAICEDRKFVLSKTELEALDSYLEPLGLGLSTHPILYRPSVLENLAERGRVVFLIGAKPHPNGCDISYWDVTAMAEVQRRVNQLSQSRDVRFELEAVPLRSSVAEARETMENLLELFADDGPSLVCLGSPRANHAAEIAFSKMLGVEPYSSTWDRKPKLPFHFIWPPGDGQLPSCVSAGVEDIRNVAPAIGAAVEKGKKWAFRLPGSIETADPRGAEPMGTFGVFAAQRRRQGQVWMVLAGLSGPGTFAAAENVRRINQTLNPSYQGGLAPLLWASVICSSHTGEGGVPALDSSDLLGDPAHWPPQ